MIVKLDQLTTKEIILNLKTDILTDEIFEECETIFIPLNISSSSESQINMYTCEDNCVTYGGSIEFTYMLTYDKTEEHENLRWMLSVISDNCTSSYEVELTEEEIECLNNLV